MKPLACRCAPEDQVQDALRAKAAAGAAAEHLCCQRDAVRQHSAAASPATLAWALAGSASTLTALHGLPIPQPSDRPRLGLTAFTRLRTLTLVHTLGSQQVAAAELLPTSLRELTLRCSCLEAALDMKPPLLCGFSRLTNLQRLTLVEYDGWLLGSRDAGADRPGRLRLPLSLKVRPRPQCHRVLSWCAVTCSMVVKTGHTLGMS